jgi:hypothetical protein
MLHTLSASVASDKPSQAAGPWQNPHTPAKQLNNDHASPCLITCSSSAMSHAPTQ